MFYNLGASAGVIKKYQGLEVEYLTLDREVGGLMPRKQWLGPNMSVKLLTGMLDHKTNYVICIFAIFLHVFVNVWQENAWFTIAWSETCLI